MTDHGTAALALVEATIKKLGLDPETARLPGDKTTQAVLGDLASQARHQLVSQSNDSHFARRGH